MDRQVDRQMNKQTIVQTDKCTNTQMDKQTNRQADKWTEREREFNDLSPLWNRLKYQVFQRLLSKVEMV